MVNKTKEKCFIITPIGEDTDPIRRHIDGIIDAAIKPALSDKYEVQAAHHISKPGSITKQVIEAIYNAKLVVANLTGRNPNVMYELALRHAIGKPVIMIVERGTPVPSDIIMQRVILYSNDAKGVLELRDDLNKAESEIVFEEKGGPIVEVLGDISHDAEMLKKVAAKDSDSREPLEYIMRRLDQIESTINSGNVKSQMPYANTMIKFIATEIEEKHRAHIALLINERLTDLYCETTAFDIGKSEIYVGIRYPLRLTKNEIASIIIDDLKKIGITIRAWRYQEE